MDMADDFKQCPKCGDLNLRSRVTCAKCHERLNGVKDLTKTRKVLWKLNAQLRTAIEKRQPQTMIINEIDTIVKKNRGAFRTDARGYAVEITKEGSEEPEVVAPKKSKRICPCCGEPCGGWFKQGHDGRIHGILLKLADGFAVIDQQNEDIQKMFKIWSKNRKLTMKQTLAKVS